MTASRSSCTTGDIATCASTCWRPSAVEVDDHTRRITVPAVGGAQALVEVVRGLDERDALIDDIGLRRPTARRRVPDAHRTPPEEETADDDSTARPLTGARRRPTGGAHDAQHPDTRPRRQGRLRSAVVDAFVVAWRNLAAVPRMPDYQIYAIVQSIMFVLLFALSSAARSRCRPRRPRYYREFLMAGLFVQTLAFASVDHHHRHDRRHEQGHHRPVPGSLPMARSAVIAGGVISNLVYNTGIIIVLMLAGS